MFALPPCEEAQHSGSPRQDTTSQRDIRKVSPGEKHYYLAILFMWLDVLFPALFSVSPLPPPTGLRIKASVYHHGSFLSLNLLMVSCIGHVLKNRESLFIHLFMTTNLVHTKVDNNTALVDKLKRYQQENEELKARMDKHMAISR